MRQIVYTVSITITQPIEEDIGEGVYISRPSVRMLELDVIRALEQSRRVEGKIDAECMGHEIQEIREQ